MESVPGCFALTLKVTDQILISYVGLRW